MVTGETVALSDLPTDITSALNRGHDPASSSISPPVADLEAVERDAISAAILACHGNLTLAAKQLRISKSTLYLKVKKYSLECTAWPSASRATRRTRKK